MTVNELMDKLRELPGSVEVRSYESEADDFVPITEVNYCAHDVEPHVRLETEFDKI